MPLTAAAQQGIHLLECFGDVCVIPTDGASGFTVFFAYFSMIYPWVLGMGAAIAVMMGLVGGIQMMTAGADDGKRSAGVNRLLMSIGGLVLLLFSSLILNLLNPTFFQ
jgi:hypothetical protein